MTQPATTSAIAAAAGADDAADAAPRAAYRLGVAERRAEAAAHARVATRLSHARLVVFLLAVALVIAAGVGDTVSGWLALLPGAAFLALVVWHDLRLRAQRDAERAVAFHERGLARLDGHFTELGATGEGFAAEDHLYALDLDLVGTGSLFQRISTARTQVGEATLARWLLAPAAIDEVRARQAAVAELRPRLGLREDLARLGDELHAAVSLQAVLDFAMQGPGRAPSPWLRVALFALSLATASTLVAWLAGAKLALPFLALVVVQSIVGLRLRARAHAARRGLDGATRALPVLAGLLARFEAERFESARLVALREALDATGLPPSGEVARLRRLADWLDAPRNQIFAPIGALLLFTTQLSLAVEAWRARAGGRLPRWVDAAGELEALCSLAGFAFERPQDVFPEIVPGATRFEATGLAHPLLPAARAVRNDVRLDERTSLLLVSGSNMSGKSTWLRSIGVAAALAQAGAPVCATRLVMSPLALGASIRVTDSLLGGASRFYAEITRLGAILRAAAARPPLLFLLDEVLAGTNSHDRRVGAEAIVRELLERGAIGLVTTHDLALAAVADGLAARAANVHFEDHLEAGRIAFDYRLRPGVVQRSNALALMRAVGIEV